MIIDYLQITDTYLLTARLPVIWEVFYRKSETIKRVPRRHPVDKHHHNKRVIGSVP